MAKLICYFIARGYILVVHYGFSLGTVVLYGVFCHGGIIVVSLWYVVVVVFVQKSHLKSRVTDPLVPITECMQNAL